MSKNIKKFKLAIETTGKICGVALLSGNKIISEKNIDSMLTHSVTLFSNIASTLKKNKLNTCDLSNIFVSAGPGSFTGIRIGIAAALGIAKPFKTRITYIDTLDSLAYNVKEKADIIISMIDAKAGRVFMSIFKGDTLKKILVDSIYDVDNLINCLNNYFTNKNISFVFVGDGAIKYKNKLLNFLKIKYKFADNKEILQKASSLFFVKGKSSKKVNINYLLKSKAERERLNHEN